MYSVGHTPLFKLSDGEREVVGVGRSDFLIWSEIHSTVEKLAKRTPDIIVETTNEKVLTLQMLESD